MEHPEPPSPEDTDRKALELHAKGIARTVFPGNIAGELEALCSRTGMTPDQFPHLLDVMYRESAMRARLAELNHLHQTIMELHMPAIREKAFDHESKDQTLVQTAIPIPLEYLMALEGFLGEARRLITHVVLLVATAHNPDASREFVSLEELVKKIRKAEPIQPGDGSCQAMLRQHAPRVAREIADGSDTWLGTLKDHRDDLEHRTSLAGSYIEFYATEADGEVHSGSKIYTVEGERLLEFVEEVAEGAEALVKSAIRHLSSITPKGSTEARVDAQVFINELRQQSGSGTAYAPLIVYHVKPISHEEFEADRAKRLREPRKFTFD
jgi:hypothetical protein